MSPSCSLLVIRSADPCRAEYFYRTLGLHFELEVHGSGPAHYASQNVGFVFEIYPMRNEQDVTTNVRFGFAVEDVNDTAERLAAIGSSIVSPPIATKWGQRAVLKDFDGHIIELTNKPAQDKIQTYISSHP